MLGQRGGLSVQTALHSSAVRAARALQHGPLCRNQALHQACTALQVRPNRARLGRLRRPDVPDHLRGGVEASVSDEIEHALIDLMADAGEHGDREAADPRRQLAVIEPGEVGLRTPAPDDANGVVGSLLVPAMHLEQGTSDRLGGITALEGRREILERAHPR